MKTTELKKLIDDLDYHGYTTYIEAEIRTATPLRMPIHTFLRWALPDNNEDEGEKELYDLNTVLAPYSLEADWTGDSNDHGDGNTTSDADVSITIEDAEYKQYGLKYRLNLEGTR